MFSKILIIALSLSASSAFASYKKMAECNGITDKAVPAAATLFVNQANDTVGLVVVSVQGLALQVSDTAVEWTPAGYPRFHGNDYDLDIVITDTSVSTDDVLVGPDYVSQLNCVYQP